MQSKELCVKYCAVYRGQINHRLMDCVLCLYMVFYRYNRQLSVKATRGKAVTTAVVRCILIPVICEDCYL